MDHLFQAARDEPVGTSIGDLNEMLDNSVVANSASGSSALLSKAAVIKGTMFLGLAAVCVFAFQSLAELDQEPVRVAEFIPIEVGQEDSQPVIQAEIIEESETPAIVEPVIVATSEPILVSNPQLAQQNTATAEKVNVTPSDEGPKADVNLPLYKENPEAGLAGTYIADPKQKEANLNNVFVDGDMPPDPFAEQDGADLEPIIYEVPLVLERKCTELDLETLSVKFKALGVDFDIKQMVLKRKKLKYIQCEMSAKPLDDGANITCGFQASDFNHINFLVRHDGNGNVECVKVFIISKNNGVINCGCPSN